MIEWKDAYKKPEDDRVVLISVTGLDEHGIVSAWWCVEDYSWIALDDLEQFCEEQVNWWAEMINLPPCKP